MVRNLDRDRRRFVVASVSALGLAIFSPLTRLQAAGLPVTPAQPRGPFYPLDLPPDRDNDLVTVTGHSGIATGEITHIVGRVVDDRGRPVPRARIEIWQVNAHGRYHHPGDHGERPLDPNFQGYGRCVTGPDGAYRFRTIKPVGYRGRAPHIHFAIHGPGFEPLVTQMYVAGAPENAQDWVLNGIRDPHVRQSLVVRLVPMPGANRDELLGRFDIILAASRRVGTG
jgi:protocatechuate 3,4-dioxygenase, beta subunit